MDSSAGSHDICNRICGTHLVEAHFFHRDSVNFSLSHCNPVKDRERAGFYIRDQGGLFQQLPDLAVIPPVLVVMLIGSRGIIRMMSVGMQAVHMVGMRVPGLTGPALRFPLSGFRALSMAVHFKFHAGDILAGTLVEMRVDFVSEDQRGNCLEDDIFLHTKIPESADSHVAADP